MELKMDRKMIERKMVDQMLDRMLDHPMIDVLENLCEPLLCEYCPACTGAMRSSVCPGHDWLDVAFECTARRMLPITGVSSFRFVGIAPDPAAGI
ncbi:hypothetical protein ES708_17286 [subsurface metagenome]